MPQQIWLDRKTAVHLDPKMFLAEGGEATVWRYQAGSLIKVYKPEDYPGIAGIPPLEEAVRARLREMQAKLPDFPKTVPAGLIAPRQLAYSTGGPRGKIVGYEMAEIVDAINLRQLADRDFRMSGGITQQSVLDVFKLLYDILQKLHDAGMVVGDLNPFNVLVVLRQLAAHIIDADSIQFGQYICTSYTPDYVDPLICKRGLKLQEMEGLHSASTDWYAFAMLLFEVLTYGVHPYGGTYKGKGPQDKIGDKERALRRIWVGHPQVKYPPAGLPLHALPDTFLQFYRDLVEKDVRQQFPRSFLDNMRFDAGKQTAHLVIPARPSIVAEKITAEARSTRIFDVAAPGVILQAVVQDGRLRYLYNQDDAFYREGTSLLMKGKLDPSLRLGINGDRTLVTKGAKTFLLAANQPPVSISAEQFRSMYPVVVANGSHHYWSAGGQIWREGPQGPKALSTTLENQTMLFVGASFGFAFYQGGEFKRTFLFDTEDGSRSEMDILSVLSGTLIDMRCSFSEEQLWLFLTVQEKRKLINRAALIRRDGALLASSEEEQGSNSWLGSLGGKTAAALPRKEGGKQEVLFATTNDGIVQVEKDAANLAVTRTYPGTTSLVHHGVDNLLFSTLGLHAWNTQEIRLITMQMQ
jgi:H/ACA ribonucleoprotein complex subunit 3